MWLLFEPIPKVYKDNNSIGGGLNVGGLNFDGPSFYVHVNPGAFDEIYDIVRNESPVRVVYSYKDLPNAPATTKLVTNVWVGTEPEVPGEGAPDPGAAANAVIGALANP